MNYSNDFNNETYWQTIKTDVLQHIPAIPSGADYQEWLKIVSAMRAAGCAIDEALSWGKETDGLPQNKWQSLHFDGDAKAARAYLVSIAQKWGYKLPQTAPQRATVSTTGSEVATITHNAFVTAIRWQEPPTDEKTIEAAVHNAQRLFAVLYGKEGRITTAKANGKKPVNINTVSVDAYNDFCLSRFLCEDGDGKYYQLNAVDEKLFSQYLTEKPQGSIKDEHIKSFAFAYIEADSIPIDEQKQYLAKIDLPWLAIIHSGNKSLHTIIRLDAETEADYKERLAKVWRYLDGVKYPYDPNVKNPARWGRFPCCKRGDGWQYVAAINDAPVSFATWQQRHEKDLTIDTPPLDDINFFDWAKKIVKQKDKDGNNTEKEIWSASVNDGKFQLWLEKQGYRAVYDKSTDKMMQVKINGHFIRKIDYSVIIAEVSQIVSKRKNVMEIEAFAKWRKTARKSYFDGLQMVNIKTHTDTADSVYFYFKNGILDITANDYRLISYDTLGDDAYLWQDAFTSLQYDFHFDGNKGEFQRFVENIMSDYRGGEIIPNIQKAENLMSIYGYLLSRHKNRGIAKAVLLMDSKADYDSPESTGGTGKGLLLQGIEYLRAVGRSDGKTMSDNQRFAFANITPGQTVYLLDDVKSNFVLQSLYPKITDAFEIEQKGKDKMTIPFDEAPKIAITSNFVLRDINSVSSKRRLLIAELSNYYSDCHSPADDFGHNFFSGWSKTEFDRFFSYCVLCVQRFLRDGVKSVQSASLERKALLADVPSHIIDFIEDCLMTKYPLDGERHEIRDIYEDYMQYMDNRGKRLVACNKKSFAIAIKKYFEGGIVAANTAAAKGWAINKSQCKVFQGDDAFGDGFGDGGAIYGT